MDTVHFPSNTTQLLLSVPDGCVMLETAPLNSTGDIVSADVEEWTSRIFCSLAIPVLFFIGAPGNLLSVAVFARQGLGRRVHLCLFLRALADLLVNCSTFSIYGERFFSFFTRYRRFSEVFVFVITKGLMVFFGFSYVSLCISAILALERCWCVVSPLHSHACMKTKTMACLLACLSLGIIGLFYPTIANYKLVCLYDPVSNIRTMSLVDGEFYYQNKAFIDFVRKYVFGTAIPMTCFPVVLVTTVVTSFRLKMAAKWRTSAALKERSMQPEITLTKMLIGTSVLFIACLTPACVRWIIKIIVPEFTSGGKYHNAFLSIVNLAELCLVINCTFNVFIYYSLGSRFRETVKEMFPCLYAHTNHK